MSLEKKRNGLIIVGDFSRFTWVLFLSNKVDSFEAFKNFFKNVQNEKSCNIISIHTDHDKEFENHMFETFCDEYGIFHNFSMLYTTRDG